MKRWRERRSYGEYGIMYRGGRGHIWTGVLLLLIGAAALVKASVTDLPDWVFSWQMLLIVLGLFIGLRHRFRGGAWFILIVVGSVFLIRDIYPDLAMRRYLWPIIMITIGVFLILRPRRYHGGKEGWDEKKMQG